MSFEPKIFPTPEQMLTSLRMAGSRAKYGPMNAVIEVTHVGQYYDQTTGRKFLVNIWTRSGWGFTINAFYLDSHGEVVIDSAPLGVVAIHEGDQLADPIETVLASARRGGVTDIVAL